MKVLYYVNILYFKNYTQSFYHLRSWYHIIWYDDMLWYNKVRYNIIFWYWLIVVGYYLFLYNLLIWHQVAGDCSFAERCFDRMADNGAAPNLRQWINQPGIHQTTTRNTGIRYRHRSFDLSSIIHNLNIAIIFEIWYDIYIYRIDK